MRMLGVLLFALGASIAGAQTPVIGGPDFSSSSVNALIQSLSGCGTSGNVYSPKASGCVANGSGSMVYPGTGMALSNGTGWNSSLAYAATTGYLYDNNGVLVWQLGIPYSILTGAPTLPSSASATSHQWLSAYNAATGAYTFSQPSFADLSGSLSYSALTNLPALAATINAAAHEWISSYNAVTGAFTQGQPAFSDLSGNLGTAQGPSSLTGLLYDASGTLGAASAAQIVAAIGSTPVANATAAATASNLASYPTPCSGGQFSQGLSSGSNNCATPSGGSSSTITGSGLTAGNVYYAAASGLVAAEANGNTATATFTNSSASISATNSFWAGQAISFASTGTLPTNFATGTTYYVISTGLSGTAFEVSATVGGTAIVAGSAGSGTQSVLSSLLPAVCVASSTTACQINGVYTTTGLTAGAVYYVSDSSAGAITATKPTTSGHYIQRVGVALSSTQLLIQPSLDVATLQ